MQIKGELHVLHRNKMSIVIEKNYVIKYDRFSLHKIVIYSLYK